MKLSIFFGMALAGYAVAQAADPAPAASAKPSTNAPIVLSNPEAASVLKTDVDRVSYSFGLTLGSNIKQNDVEANVDAILRGLKDGLAGAAPLMNPQEMQQVQDQFRKDLMAKREAKAAVMRERNQAAGEKFLAEYAKKADAKSFTNGVLYRVLKEGTGPKPKTTDRVAVQYRGTLINGTEFDSSYKRGPEPAVFGVTQVIKGWTTALTNMPVGSKWEIVIPADLAYGSGGTRNIEPNSTLIFEVDLVDIKQAELPPQPITSDIIKVPSKAELDAGAKIEILKPDDVAKLTNKANQAKPAANPGGAQKPAAPTTAPK